MDADWSVELGGDDAALEFPWSSPDGSQRYRDLQRHPELLVEIPEAVQFPELGEFLRELNSPASPWLTAKCDVWTEKKVEATSESVLQGRGFSDFLQGHSFSDGLQGHSFSDVLKGHGFSRAANVLYPSHSEWALAHEEPAFPVPAAACEAMPLQSAGPGVKFCSYVDLIFREDDARFSFDRHEQWVRSAARALSNDDDLPVACEFIVRRCWYHPEVSPMREFDDTSTLDGESLHPGFYVTFYLFGYGSDERQARLCWADGLRRAATQLTGLSL